MFNMDLGRMALSALGALVFTITLVGAAVGPAHMVEASPLVYAGAAPQAGGGVDA
jgi:hypothetical protein